MRSGIRSEEVHDFIRRGRRNVDLVYLLHRAIILRARSEPSFRYGIRRTAGRSGKERMVVARRSECGSSVMIVKRVVVNDPFSGREGDGVTYVGPRSCRNVRSGRTESSRNFGNDGH